MNTRIRSSMVAVRALIGAPLAGLTFAAAGAEPAADSEKLPTLYISAAAIREDAADISSSFSVLDGEALFHRLQGTLGDTLESLPGLRSDTFGGGAARPVIRGQGAPRVQVLSDSASLADASDISPDHAVTAEPMLVERVEVLRGPATLLYGSGAIGGVVNLLDRRIPDTRPDDGFDGAVAIRGGTVADERAVAGELTGSALGDLVFHLEGSLRDADDYRVPDWEHRRVEGSRARSRNASAGLSWVTDRGFLGLAYSLRDDDYGLPGHDHEYEGCHPHDNVLHCGAHGPDEDGHDHDHEDASAPAFPVIDLASRRVDVRGEIESPFAGVEGLRLRASHTDYRHDEIEGGEVGTTFRKDAYELRLEVRHAAVLGWRGVAGLQYGSTKASAEGEEAFLPTTQSESLGLFMVEHFEVSDALHFELGARQEWQEHRPLADPRGRPRFSDSATSVSGAAIWEFATDHAITLSAARSERLPHVQELYARGIHLATNTYECGLVPHPLTCGGAGNDAPLAVETSRNLELSVRRSAGRLTWAANAYWNRVDDFVYARTLDRFENFRLIKYTQQDAEFAGFEAEVTWRLSEALSATVFGDRVRAEFADGGRLPRIPASRVGARLVARRGNLGGEIEYIRMNRQDDIATYETVTAGYDMANLTVSYGPTGGRWSVFARGTNLLDEQAFNPVSFLANVVPLPGRNLVFGARLSY